MEPSNTNTPATHTIVLTPLKKAVSTRRGTLGVMVRIQAPEYDPRFLRRNSIMASNLCQLDGMEDRFITQR